ncbi:hypothetical protein D3C86_2262020 [compost metagenome]
MKGGSSARLRITVVGNHSTRCIQGWMVQSEPTTRARMMTMGATRKITNTAGPSPLSAKS